MPYGPPDEDVQTPSLPGINQGGELDPKIAQLLQIMKLLGNPAAPTPPPQPEPLKKWQKILFGGTGRDFLGSIGDSLAAQSSVLAGGAPPAIGAHAMQVRQRQMDQAKLMEDYRAQVERQSSDQENFKRQIALQFMKDQKTVGPKNVERDKYDALGPDGKMHTYRDILDTSGDVTRKDDLGVSKIDVEPKKRTRLVYDRVGNAYEQNVDTNEVRPIKLPGGDGQAGKPFTAAEKDAAGAVETLRSQLKDFRGKAEKFSKKSESKFMSTARATAQTGVRSSGELGMVASEALGDPEFESLAALRDRIGLQLARLVENNRLSDQDREFALRNLPSVASLTTKEGRENFKQKIQIVSDEMEVRIKSKERLSPGLISPEEDAYQQFLKRYREGTDAQSE